MRVLLFGATGTIGQAVAEALGAAGHSVVAVGRRAAPGIPNRSADLHDPRNLVDHAIQGEGFDAVVSCLASRSGAPKDAWSIDHDAHQSILQAAQTANIPRFVQLSAVCVQQPELAFQQAKLAFETTLKASGLTWTIIRPTAFFKSLSGQVARVAQGKPFMVFGDGKMTACKPISDRDLAAFIVESLTTPETENMILPIGGPGPAITPMDQHAMLETLLGRPVAVRRMPIGAMRAIVSGLSMAGTILPQAAQKASLARIGLYYATHSMLVVDPDTQRASARATPQTGSDRLIDHYKALLSGEITHDLADHAVF